MNITAANADIIIKVLLVVLGAVLGSLFTRRLNQRRLRNVVPVVLRQLDAAANACCRAFTLSEAASAAVALDAAAAFAKEVIGAEVNPRFWREGATLIAETQARAMAVAAGGKDNVPATTQALRSKGKELLVWVQSHA